MRVCYRNIVEEVDPLHGHASLCYQDCLKTRYGVFSGVLNGLGPRHTGNYSICRAILGDVHCTHVDGILSSIVLLRLVLERGDLDVNFSSAKNNGTKYRNIDEL